MALSHLLDAGEDPGPARQPASCRRRPCGIGRADDRAARLNAPLTSSAGRLFDAVAALRRRPRRGELRGPGGDASSSGWPTTHRPRRRLPVRARSAARARSSIDTRPLIARASPPTVRPAASRAASRGGSTRPLVEIIAAVVCVALRAGDRPRDAVALSGGVFLNALLLTATASAPAGAPGSACYRHRQVPPNDGGLSLGQLAVAAAQLPGAESACASASPAGSSRSSASTTC